MVGEIKPFYERNGIKIYHGDSLDLLRQMHHSAVGAVITDPPYSSGGAFRGDRLVKTHTKYIKPESANNSVGEFSGDTRDGFGHWYWQSLWLSQCLRIVKPGGVGAVFTDWRQIALTIGAIQSGGWVYRGIAHWHKPSGRPIQGRYANVCEYIVWGTNGPRPLNALGGRALPGHWSATAPHGREHMTQKPIEVMKGLVEIVPEGDIILDPFMGSGTTLIAACLTGRRAIGIEIDERHCELAARRLDEQIDGRKSVRGSVEREEAPTLLFG